MPLFLHSFQDSNDMNVWHFSIIPQAPEILFNFFFLIFFSPLFRLNNLYWCIFKFTNTFLCCLYSAIEPIQFFFFLILVVFSSSIFFIWFFFKSSCFYWDFLFFHSFQECSHSLLIFIVEALKSCSVHFTIYIFSGLTEIDCLFAVSWDFSSSS